MRMGKSNPADERMGKRKPADESSIAEQFARVSKHRSCWKHVASCMYACRIKITKQQLWSFVQTSPCYSDEIPCRRRSKRKVNLRCAITKSIKEKKMLDSGAFDCYFEFMWKTFAEEKRTSFTYFDCLWFSLYMKRPYKADVLTYIRRKQIFSKNYVIVPIVYWTHWSLLIFCHFGESLESKARTPCILLLDSLKMADPRRLEPHIRKFVLDIYGSEGRAENKHLIYKIPLLVPEVPQQRNDEDCGKYVLYFINQFVQHAPQNFSVTDGYPYFMNQNWFNPEGVKQFFEGLESHRKGYELPIWGLKYRR